MEIWKEIKDYENYQVSNLGNVKSLNYNRTGKESVLKAGLSKGYFQIVLHNNGLRKTKPIHQLVSECFLNHTPSGYNLVINHINHIRTDNRVENLEIVTNRENTNRKHLKSTSEFVGVFWDKQRKKWRSKIRIGGKLKYLGSFNNEIEASQAYQKTLNNI